MTDSSCFTKVLRIIDALQRSNEQEECFDNTCARPFLGANITNPCFNTRPVTFYGCNNNLITIVYDTVVDGTRLTGTSSIFRVERVNDNSVTVSILIENQATADPLRPYIAVRDTAIINLDCVCAIKCLADAIVDL